MDTSRARRPGREQSGGFVLVGVVMFVLALTILGLSVFSLSSYEAQFLRNSRDEVQVYNDAMGGVARAAFVISETGRLDSCRVLLPVNVDSTRAWDLNGKQDGAPGTQDVWVKVAASRGSARRTVQARLRPTVNESYYNRTLHSASTVAIDIGPSGVSSNTIRLGYSVRQTVDNSSWMNFLATPTPADWQRMDIPVPDAAGFVAAKESSASQPPGGTEYDLNNPNPNSVRYFLWPDTTGRPGTPGMFTLYNPRQNLIDIEVHGMVVWVVRRGMRFEGPVRVDGHGPGDALVIVAGASDRVDENYLALGYRVGIEFMGGLSADCPVILVTNGTVSFDRNQHGTEGDRVDYFSAYALGFSLRGPLQSSGRTQQLLHDQNAPEDRPNGLIDKLIRLGALPNATGTVGSHYDLVAGTWQDVTP